MHETASGCETLLHLRDRGFHRRVGVASFLVSLQPRDDRCVLAVQLVASRRRPASAPSIASPARIVSIVSARVAAVLRTQRSRSAL